MNAFSRALVRIVGPLAAALALASCGDDGPGPYGAVGAPCASHTQCPTGHCCTEKHCGGVCTFRCGDDRDCPAGMGCEHGVCLWACRGDVDCAPGQKCKHGDVGVCEYE